MSLFKQEVEEKLEDGFKSLVTGYGKYSAEVVVDRAFPAIDGLKPSQRRILYTMQKHKIRELQKSANVCGKVLEYHPHSDASVYDTAIRMVDSAEYTSFPLIHGKGNFSKVYFSAKDSQPAASRYTEMCLSDKAEEYFGEMDGIPFQLTEDGHTTEPRTLPVSFPSILCTPTQGIAVGVACNIPAFNFNDVLGLTIDYLKNGKITRVIAPDYACGAEYVLNNNALRQIMTEGRGQIKLRGKWYVEGKDIVITSLPYYSDINGVLTKARALRGVSNANDETDLKGMRVRITCTSKAVVNAVVLELLRDTPLQVTTTANIATIIDDAPVFTGVIGIIEKWAAFRRTVLDKQYKLNLDRVRSAMRAPKAMVELIENVELKNRFLDAMKTSAAEAEKVLREGMPHVDDDVIDYILDLKVRQFADCEGRKRQYAALVAQEQGIIKDLANLDAVIIAQLTALNNKYVIPRKTAIVTNDYSFESIEEQETAAAQVADYVVSVQVENLFIRKIRIYTSDKPALKCRSVDTVSLLDNRGRLLRIPLDQVPDCAQDAIGTYIPTILNIPADFEVVHVGIVEDKKYNFLYKDGYIAQLDMSEWLGLNRVTRITERGVAPDRADLFFKPVDTSLDYLMVQTKNRCLGIFSTDFKVKARTARTKLGGVDKNDEIIFAAPITAAEACMLLSGDTGRYYNRCCPLFSGVTFNKAIYREILKRG